LAGRLLTTFKQRVRELVLVPAGGGCFEVSLDGDLAYSKLETGKFPDEGDIAEMVSARLK
jgi:selenoprotein W-related protein